MNGVTPNTEVWLRIAKEATGWAMLGGVLYGLYGMVPQVAQLNIDAYSSLAAKFATQVQRISDAQVEAAKERTMALDVALRAYREDEREDRRLLVEILKRSDLTPGELQEAIEETVGTEKGPRVPGPD